jgi:hypothetical protein
VTDSRDWSPLDAAREWLGRYLRTVNDSDLDLLALWAAHTHVVEEVYTTPRLLIDSPVPGSGKTTALEHLYRLCVAPVQMASVSSPALLARLLEQGMRTLLIDEADRTLRPDSPTTPDLVAVLNSGYKRGATRPVLVPAQGGQWVPKEMPTFAPVAMAGNSPALPEDTMSRTIRVLLLPDLDGTVAESDWELIEADAAHLGAQLAEWVEAHRDEIAATRPAMPGGIVGRFREKWQPLARVAAIAGGRWPAVVTELSIADKEQVKQDREDGMITTRPHITLLQHISAVWPAGARFVPTSLLIDLLTQEHPDYWGPESSYGKALTVQRLGRMMARNYKVNTRQPYIAGTEERPRGYQLADLAPVFERMGIPVPSEPFEPPEASQPNEATNSSSGSGGSNGLEIKGKAELFCTVCRQRLDAVISAEGWTTCPSCDPST